MANALTALRLLLVIPFAVLMTRGDRRSAVFALIVWVVALATDFADGPIARRHGTVTPLGGAFDHTSDFLFVVSGIFAGASRDAFPWILPVCITAAFLQYAIDSYWLHRQIKFRGSKLGRYNGMLYFVPAVVDILIRLGARLLQPLLTILVWALLVSTLASMVQRFIFSRLAAENFASGAPQK
jgi:CDP-diacylglycerol--glycerol-3-phosphate 3-phosphatidyltransferase